MNKRISILSMIIAIVCMIAMSLQAQNAKATRTISGVVSDNSGALPGAQIVIKGGYKGVISDVDGRYSIDVPENAVLVFLFFGYIHQEIAVENKTEINVTMKESEERLCCRQGKLLNLVRPIRFQLTEKQTERARVDNNFALKMFREVSKQGGDNMFFSPLSLNMALGMLYNGTSGATREEMAKTLGITGFSETEINEYYQKISQALLNIEPSTTIEIANSIWYRNTFSVKNSFIKTCKTYFDADMQALDFNSPTASNTINNWVADKTNDKITNLIDGAIPNNVMMYLMNALYFKGQWHTDIKFEKSNTKRANFTQTNKQKVKVNMMEQTSSMNYYADDHLQSIEMDYGNGAFSMVAVLPTEDMNINQLIDYLDGEKLQAAIDNMRWHKVWLKLPRFKIEQGFSLNRPIQDLGMKQMFKGGLANISDGDLQVSDIIQKTFVEVNEDGTEAAAATAIIAYGGYPKKIEPIRFFADRPFLYLIREKSTGIILFVGRMDEPCE
jgi:serpin B